MNVEKFTKEAYDKFGKEYQKGRDEKDISRVYNTYIELPNMIKIVGNIKNKKLLDVGCGAGVHIKKYLKKGAKVKGIDISQTMISLAEKRCPSVNFKIGSINKLPFKQSSFDIVTASLIVDYIDNLTKAFKEVAKVLKKGGLFYYSNNSVFNATRGLCETSKALIDGVGHYRDKKTGKVTCFGDVFQEGLKKWDMLPGMTMYTYNKTFRTQLKALINAGFELVDIIDCKPTRGFKRTFPQEYERFCRLPLFTIFVARKK